MSTAISTKNMQEFNHNINDLALADQKISTSVRESTLFLHNSIITLETEIKSIWKFLKHFAEQNELAVKSSSDEFEQLQSILATISKRSLPLLTQMTEVYTNIPPFETQIAEMLLHFEGIREKYQFPPMSLTNSKQRNDVETPIFTPKESAYMNLLQEQQKIKPVTNNSILQLAVEEMRIKVNELNGNFDMVSSKMNDFVKEIVSKMEIKADESTIFREFVSLQKLTSNLQKRIEDLESSVSSSQDLSRMSTIKNSIKRTQPDLKTEIKAPRKSSPTKTAGKKAKDISSQVLLINAQQPKSARNIHSRPQSTVLRLASNNIKNSDFD